jgi:acetoin utilization deacetylase AcuC-like enzyme
MRAVFDPAQRAHEPRSMVVLGVTRPSPEQVERVDRLLEGLDRLGVAVGPAKDFGDAPRSAVHSAEYLQFLQNAHQDWNEFEGASGQVVANVHPRGPGATYPDSIVGRAGWHMFDTACPIGPETYRAACASANSALTAAEMVLSGDRFAYALCRPPGHHAFASAAGGFCYLNNVAITVEHLRRHHERVAVLDIDVHHGNGTQQIFYGRRDVLTVSIHVDPLRFYPYFWGYAHERGVDEGLGFNLNLPLARGSGDDVFLEALAAASAAIEGFAPGALVIALGLDAAEKDPLGVLNVSTDGFRRVGARIAALGLPTVYVQEGGYLSETLADDLSAVLAAAAGT